MPADAVYVGRPTRWGNPFAVGSEGVPDRATSLARYEAWLATQPSLVAAARAELAGRDLVCWCPLENGPCHADVLLEVANRSLWRH
jgi:hypothetical protein